MSKPRWVNPDRQSHLVSLFAESGLKCQQGHTNCPTLEHYLHTESKISSVAKAVDVQCYNSNGDVLRDKQGNTLYLTVYKSVPVIETKQSLLTQYELLSETAIDNWIAEDRQKTQQLWKAERYLMHSLSEKRLPLRGRFNNISSEIWHNQQPIFYLESLGMDGLKLKPFAKVKLSSSYQYLYVDLGDSLRGISKNRKRKAIRYGKPLPQSVDNIIAGKVWEAVKHYLKY